MDSLSQFALGAVIGEATLGRSLGRKALIVGGLLGTLPDLDVLVSYTDAVESFTYHRSWSHSLFVLALLSPALAWVLHRWYPASWRPASSSEQTSKPPPGYSQWWLCVFLILITHPILDGFTIYGTQLLWPLQFEPIAWGSMFIIDPLYTLPLIIAIWVAWKHRKRASKVAIVALIVSSLYLALSLLSQRHARSVAIESLSEQGLATQNVLIAPAPFSVLWRIVSMDDDVYYEGFYSLLDSDSAVLFNSFESNRELIDEQYDHWPIARLDWFTRGMISASVEDDNVIINDLRMGVEASYVFRFLVGKGSGSAFQPLESEQMPIVMDSERIGKIVQRAWNEKINVEP